MRRVGLKSNLKSDLSGRKRDCAMGQASILAVFPRVALLAEA